ncbi:MAG: hypothetical protein CSYNP_02505 [Syntrophus sp. SKADARSKE-3]|nr:hypothetical protein [Syntrophus sp. SKADARSKE-3]
MSKAGGSKNVRVNNNMKIGLRARILLGFLALAFMSPLTGWASDGNRGQSAVPADYSLKQNWLALPTGSQPVDVFFVYPTTYNYNSKSQPPLTNTWSPGWNQSLAKAYTDPIIKALVYSKIGVFSKAGTNVYAPYYQQCSGIDVLNALLWQNTPQFSDAANQAMHVAYTDVSNAFDYYLAHYNKGRPFILAGHSQGANLLLLLLENKFKDAALRKQLVVAYVIGWSVTSDDMNSFPDSLAKVGICRNKAQTGCIVTYNTQQTPGDWTQVSASLRGKMELVRKNSYSVNPLSWAATDPGTIEASASPATANLGAVFFRGSLPGADQKIFKLQPDGSYTYEVKNYIGAQSNNGALTIDPTALPAPASYKNFFRPYNTLPGWYHGYDYTFFYRNIEQNVIDRIKAYKQYRTIAE